MRTDTYDLDTRLQAALEPHLSGETSPYNNYSLRLGGRRDDGAMDLHALYGGSGAAVASRSSQRVVDALLSHLSDWVLHDRADLVGVRAVAAVNEDRALLLPPQFAGHQPAMERTLAKAGWSLVDQRLARLDAASGEMVVSACQLDVDLSVLSELRDSGRPASEGQEPARGRYRVAAWALPGPSGGPVTRAAALARALRLVERPAGLTGQALLDCLSAAFARAAAVAVGHEPRAAARSVVEAARDCA